MLLIVGGILLACCCLVVTTGLVYKFFIAPYISNTIQSIGTTPQGIEVPPVTATGAATLGDLPSGGRTDDILRRDIWAAIDGAASGLGCTTDAAQTTIDVTQAPDANGLWIEKWTVACSSGGPKVFDVTFTPTAGGGTDYSITASP